MNPALDPSVAQDADQFVPRIPRRVHHGGKYFDAVIGYVESGQLACILPDI